MNKVEKAAKEAIEREQYEVAMRLLRGWADSGSAEAQYLLGHLYFTSADVELAESTQWLERAAAQDHSEALFDLSNLNDDGTTGPPDSDHRRTLLLRAAELGSLRAQRDLGCYYATGDFGFTLDLRLGRLWYLRAAERGHADALFNYGIMVINGEGGPADEHSGLEWVRLAAAQNDESALRYLSLVDRL